MEPVIEPIPSELLPEDKRFKKLKNSEILFAPPFTMAAIGAIGAGKTSFVYTLIDKLYKNYFDEVIVICATLDSKSAWENVHQRNVLFLNVFDDAAFMDYIHEIGREQEERKEKGKFPLRVAVILDDLVMEGFNKNRAGTLEDLLMTCRHYFISVLFCLQHSKQISPAMRNQIFYWVLFRLTANDLNKIAEEHGNLLNKDQFIHLYNEYQSKGKHEFIIINYKRPIKERFQHRFTHVIKLDKYLSGDYSSASDTDDAIPGDSG